MVRGANRRDIEKTDILFGWGQNVRSRNLGSSYLGGDAKASYYRDIVE